MTKIVIVTVIVIMKTKIKSTVCLPVVGGADSRVKR